MALSRVAKRLTFLLLLVALPSYGGVKDEWEKARSDNTAQALATFIEKHPNNKYLKDAEAALRRARFDFATRANDAGALEAFIKLYPVGADTEKAKELLQGVRQPKTKDAVDHAPGNPPKPSAATSEPLTQSWMVLVAALVFLVVVVGVVVFRRKSASDSSQQLLSPNRPTRSIDIETLLAVGLISAGVLWLVGLIVLGAAAAVDNYVTPLPFEVTAKFKVALGYSFFAWFFILLPLAFLAGLIDIYNADKIDRPSDTSTWPMIVYTAKKLINKHSAGHRFEILSAEESRLAITIAILFVAAVGGGVYRVLNR